MATLVVKTDKKYHQFRSSFQEIEVDSSEEGATILMYACQQENVEQLRLILKKKPEAIEERDRTLKTVLHYCAENMTPNCAELVLDDAPDLLDMTDEDGYTTLHLAVIAGNFMLVNYLISKSADVNKLDAESHSVIHWATVCGETDLLQILLKNGANPSTPDVHGGYPIHYAAQMCGTVSEIGNDVQLGLDVLRTLLNYRVNVDVTDHDGRQPLLWAASAGSSDAVLALINSGASIQARDKDGLSALHCAASRGHTDCIETLIKLCGANVDLVDSNGCSALFYCVTLGHADVTQLLLQCGANPNLQDRKGRTPAHCGAAKGQFETLRLLKKYNGNLWIRNIRGDYCLHEAVNAGRKELVKWLLSQRPDAVNASNIDGRCPLHIAASTNNIEMCKILLDYQAIINSVMRTSKGDLMTPLDTALHKSNRGCAKYLQLHGGVPANKLSSHSAALRGLRRIEPHSDYHGFSDSKLEIPFQSRNSRSLDTSPCEHRILQNGKVQVRIRADISSANVRETNVCSDGIKCTYKKTRWENSKHYNKEYTNLCNLKGSVTKNKKYMRDETVRSCNSSSSAESNFSDIYDYSSEDEKRTKKKLRLRRRHKKKTNNSGDAKHFVRKKSVNANDVVCSKKIVIETKDESQKSDVARTNMSLTSFTEVTKNMESEKNADCAKNQQKVMALVHREEESETKESVKSESSDSGSKVIQYQKLGDDKITDDADANTIYETNVDKEGTWPIFKCDEDAADADGQSRKCANDDQLTKKYVIDSGGMEQFDREVPPQFDHQQRDSIENSRKDDIPPNYEYVGQNDSPNVITTENIRDVQQNLNSPTTQHTKSSRPNVFEPLIDDDDGKDAKNIAQSQIAITKYSTEVDEAITLTMKQLNEADHGCQLSFPEMRANDFVIVNTNESIFNTLKNDDHVQKNDNLKLEQDHDAIVRARCRENYSSSEIPKSKGLLCVILDNEEPAEIRQQNEVMISKNTPTSANIIHRKNEKKGTPKQQRRFGSSFQILPSPSENMKHSSALTLHNPNISHTSNSNREEISNGNRLSKTPGATSSNLEERDKEKEFDENISSITRAVQNSLRKYHLERRIFHTLLELKRLQIRAGKSNEQILIKRLIDDYQKAGVIVGLRQYDGIYSFRHFERYLYEQLRTLQSTNRKDIPRIKSTDDFEKLKKALRRTRAGKTILENVPNNPLFCTFGTHRCIHATHAYTGIPCAAYIAKMDHHLMPKYIDETYPCFLPRIDHNKRTRCKQPNELVKSLKNVDPSKPVTLELIHGAEKQIISLPTEKLDQNKRYYVTFTIKGANNADEKFYSDVEKEFVESSAEKKIHQQQLMKPIDT